MISQIMRVAVLGFAATWAIPGIGQVASTKNSAASVPVNARTAATDPERVVCVVEDTTGSRLGKKRTCFTAAQWMEARREMRNTVDRVQANRGYNQQTDAYLRGLTSGNGALSGIH